MTTRRIQIFIFTCLSTIIIGLSGYIFYKSLRPAIHFDGQRAYRDVLTQVSFGARTPGSAAHSQTVSYIQHELEYSGWTVQTQSTKWQGFSVLNIIAYRSDNSPQILVGAHYDSRILADQDTGSGRNEPVLGANDGASGVAVLLELARTLPKNSIPVCLVFFDAEDNGGIENREWIMGSRAFVAALTIKPRAAIIVDMVGDIDLNLYLEKNSDTFLAAEIWEQAALLGYRRNFIATPKYALLDDHTPFLEAGIPAVDIVDFDYAFWHTSGDTADKVSPQSLQAVGETLWVWINSQK